MTMWDLVRLKTFFNSGGLDTYDLELSDYGADITTDGYGYFLGEGAMFGGAPTRYSEYLRASTPGSSMTALAHNAFNVVVPVHIRAETPADMPVAVQRLMALTDPIIANRAPTLQVRRDGATYGRTIDFYRVGGSEHLMRHHKSTHLTVPLVLRAPDGYWVQEDAWDFASDLTIAASAASGATDTASVNDVNGDGGPYLPWWPQFTIETNVDLTLSNETTGRSFEVDASNVSNSGLGCWVFSNPRMRNFSAGFPTGAGVIDGVYDVGDPTNAIPIRGELFKVTPGDTVKVTTRGTAPAWVSPRTIELTCAQPFLTP